MRKYLIGFALGFAAGCAYTTYSHVQHTEAYRRLESRVVGERVS